MCHASSPNLPPIFCFAGFVQHVAKAFNSRATEMDDKNARLALFLDPRYRKAAGSSKSLESLQKQVGCKVEDGVRVQRVGCSVSYCLLLTACTCTSYFLLVHVHSYRMSHHISNTSQAVTIVLSRLPTLSMRELVALKDLIADYATGLPPFAVAQPDVQPLRYWKRAMTLHPETSLLADLAILLHSVSPQVCCSQTHSTTFESRIFACDEHG